MRTIERVILAPGALCAACALTACRPTSMVDSPAASVSSAMDRLWERVDLPEKPEGVAVDRQGNLYVGLAKSTRILRIAPDGSTSDFARILPTTIPAAGPPGLLGFAFHDGDLYAALVTANPATRGVWRVDADGAAEHLAGTQAICWPNALAFDPRGNLYVTESTRSVPFCSNPVTPVGAVWRVTPDGSVDVWSEGPLLAGNGFLAGLGFSIPPLGANGIAYDRGTIWVANTERGSVVRIPILARGDAGEASDVARDPALLPLDGLTVDARGDLYAMAIGNHAVVRVDPADGSLETVASFADGDPIDYPINAVFGRGKLTTRFLYVVNSALFDPGPAGPGEPRPGPSIVRFDVGAPGAGVR